VMKSHDALCIIDILRGKHSSDTLCSLSCCMNGLDALYVPFDEHVQMHILGKGGNVTSR